MAHLRLEWQQIKAKKFVTCMFKSFRGSRICMHTLKHSLRHVCLWTDNIFVHRNKSTRKLYTTQVPIVQMLTGYAHSSSLGKLTVFYVFDVYGGSKYLGCQYSIKLKNTIFLFWKISDYAHCSVIFWVKNVFGQFFIRCIISEKKFEKLLFS